MSTRRPQRRARAAQEGGREHASDRDSSVRRRRAYRGRATVKTVVDAEGDEVWIQEYVRHRLNGCTHDQSIDKVTRQIDGEGIQAVCRSRGTRFTRPCVVTVADSGMARPESFMASHVPRHFELQELGEDEQHRRRVRLEY